jgi:hypothetical protein
LLLLFLPLALGLLMAFAWRGMKVADGEILASRLWKELLIGLCFTSWSRNIQSYLDVTDALFLGVPAKLIAAVYGATGALGTTTAIAAMLDQLTAGVEKAAAVIGETFSITPDGVVRAIVAYIATWASGTLLAICGIVYVASLFILRVMQCVGPVLAGMAAFYSLRPFWERWLGVCISLVLVQVMSFLTLQIVLLTDQTLLAKIYTAILASITDRAAGRDALQGLGAMFTVILAGTACLVGVTMLAFSIGGGMAPAMMPGWGSRPRLGGLGLTGSGAALPPPSSLSIGVNPAPRPALPNPTRQLQAPSPPPSIAASRF